MLIEELGTLLSTIYSADGDQSYPTHIKFKAGDQLIKSGEQGRFMFVIQSGKVKIHNDDLVLEEVGPNGIVGEMSLVDGTDRSACVTALEDTSVIPIGKKRFQALIREHPEFALYTMKIMSLRLRLMNERFNNAIGNVTVQKGIVETLREMAAQDPLTGKMNRRQFYISADIEIERAQRHARPLSVMMLDIDHFKSINDTYGHAAGDEAIQLVANTIQSELRSTDILARVGGEEFAVLLPESYKEESEATAERIRKTVEKTELKHNDKTITFTTSIGVSEWKPIEKNIKQAIERADNALYEAKRNGRNRVEVETD